MLQTNVSQSLTVVSTLSLKRNDPSPKKAYLYVRAEVSGHGSRRVGTVTLNLAEYRNKPAQEVNYKVESNLDRNCYVRLSITSVKLDDSMIGDNMSDVSGACASFNSGEGFDFEFGGLMPSIDLDLASLEDKKLSRPPTVVINKPRTTHKKESAADDEPLQVFDAMQAEIKSLKAQNSVLEKDVKHITKERNQLQINVSLLESAIEAEKQSNTQLVSVLEERLKLSTLHYEERLKKADEELEALMTERQQLTTELETSQRTAAGLQLESSDLQMKVEKLRQQSYQSTSLGKELELRNSKIIRLSRELDKVLTENSKLIQAVSKVKSQILDPQAESSCLIAIKQTLDQLDINLEKKPAEPLAKSRQADAAHAKTVADLKAQLEEQTNKLLEAKRTAENERLERINTERRLKSKLEEYERKVSRISAESLQFKERQSQIDAAIEHHLDTKEKARRSSVSTLGVNDQLEKIKAELDIYKLERLQMKRLLDSREADNKDLQGQLSESRQRLVEAAASNADEETKLVLLQLKNNLDDQGYCFSVEKSQLNDRIFQLETELDFLERKKNSKISELEQELAHLHAVQRQVDHSSQATTSVTDEKWQQLFQDLKLQNADMQAQLMQMENDRFKIENMLMESRAAEKKKDQSYAELLAKFSQAQDQIFDLRSQNMTMEGELVSLNERLGDALNMHNDLEEQLMMLRRVRRA